MLSFIPDYPNVMCTLVPSTPHLVKNYPLSFPCVVIYQPCPVITSRT